MGLIKICGLKDPKNAKIAIDEGTNLLGMIFVPNRSRTISIESAQNIISLIPNKNNLSNNQYGEKSIKDIYKDGQYGHDTDKILDEIDKYGPFVVGVFQNQSIEEINNIVIQTGIDIVQLHGQEPRQEYINKIKVPIITRYTLSSRDLNELIESESFEYNQGKRQLLTLFDSSTGGEGEQINWNQVSQLKLNHKVLLAGGLTPENVKDAINVINIAGVDVSSGVETEGEKDNLKIATFIRNGKIKYK
ncbi:hypothetical protein WICMUC_002497 [Wickerhamomyces mucosus]|uniref:N-(5'-phosphoribosyl)anthranilate isomerase n=1 Tax=Wickerhamomyces mucosus TaxID=1378264 RepID=A0A9P8PPJ0_9ASCO|nr:hypothetical protein WICMUC_002497 [Wickerhamomyces mucosus]